MLTENIKIVAIITIGILIVLIFWKNYLTKKSSKKVKQNKKLLEQKFVEKKYEEIIVNLINVKIKSEKWKEIEVENKSIENLLDSLNDTGGNENLRLIKKRMNNLIIQIPYKKSLIDYKIETEMETTKLKLFFEMQKETKAQVDKTNRKIIYVDLSFLR